MTLPRKIFIATPLELQYVEQIREAGGNRVEIVYDPDVLPLIRYVSDHKGGSFIRNPDQERRWRAYLSAAEILWDLPPKPEDLSYCQHLKWVQTTSTGVGQRVLELRLDLSKVIVTTARGVHAAPLAEFVFMALLVHVKRLRYLDAEQRAHRWVRYCGEDLAGKTLLTIGAGSLARATARVARAFDMQINAIVRNPDKTREGGSLFHSVLPAAELHSALGAADAVVVCVPHTSATEVLIDGPAFAAMKLGVVFINIARGSVIDEQALIESLQTGHVGFAALDVATIEPLPPLSPLWDMPNVLISPHSASTVSTENARIVQIFCENLRYYLDGKFEAMKNQLDKVALY